MRLLAPLLLLLAVAAPAAAEITLARIFGNHMVLQRDVKVPIWGRAKPREKITIKYAKQTASAKADNQGFWRVDAGPFPINEGEKMTITGRAQKITLAGVCVGDVWICSGQSNMEWAVQGARNAPAEIKASADPLLRLFTVPHAVASEPASDLAGGEWHRAGPRTVPGFSAVAYFFGRRLRHDLAVPIGLVQSTWGGTPAEAWTHLPALAGNETLRPIVTEWERILREYPAAERKYENELAAWKKKAEQAKKDCRPAPRPPARPVGPDTPHRAAGLWNAMVAPITPLAMRGVIWYQGESNAKQAEQYRTLFPALIRDWRRAWGKTFPFLFVQLANFQAVQPRVVPSAWAELRDAQRYALKEPDTGMAVTIDIGEPFNIHPRNKQEVARRLALVAKTKVYGETGLTWSGPLYREYSIDGPHLVLRFDHVDTGLKTRGDDPLRGFVIAGEDRKFRWAYARVERDTVVVWHPAIDRPAAVRYGWADNPDCNLVNGAGLPAAPFRTDDWPGHTANQR